MVLGREETLSAIFCETDRAQRMKMPLALIKVGLYADDGGCYEPGEPAFNSAFQEILSRITPLLRCYDTVGQTAETEFLLVLPGCSVANARTLAERLRDEVFGASAPTSAAEMRFQACFGITSSGGRTPFVVLREVDLALLSARGEGANSIKSVAAKEETDPAAFFLPVLQDEQLHW